MIKRFAEILSTESEIMTKHGAKFSPDAFDLLEKLLKFDPQSRIGCGGQGAQEIKEHPFFASIDWTQILE